MNVQIIGYWGAFPEADGATSCYLIEKSGYKCLLDCGSGALSRLQKYMNPFELDALLLSHYHADHVADVGSLQYLYLVQNMIQSKDKVLPIYGHQLDQNKFSSLSHKATKGIAYDLNSTLTLGPLQIRFLKTHHPVPCYAMRITDGETTIVYTADTSHFEGLVTFSEGADLLIAECSLYAGMDGSGPGHMTSEECGKLAQAAGVKQLWLSHLPHFGDQQKLKIVAKQQYQGPIQIAKETLSFNALP
ncbi:MBL fold metallo-hydrolase [Salinibacillus xinjiangensis]|uniref:MBL fold metallo-hydrolase n=1 Tax=Salinibacillus xinjiangensis TaxID=1229268 RepID=A0A6G1X7S4_9BACI|nr:MBL fold metallo-hydrolase [Salinibacillus xinjiangensis]MRG86955.1 MBL fold metallo-hydrolase [Salinibacillus xinjiangensis]